MVFAKEVRIGYHGFVKGDCLTRVNGTLSGMVRDRRILRADNERKVVRTEAAKAATAHKRTLEDKCCDPSMPLIDWLALITDLIKAHGPDKVMYTDSGYNNCELRIDE